MKKKSKESPAGNIILPKEWIKEGVATFKNRAGEVKQDFAGLYFVSSNEGVIYAGQAGKVITKIREELKAKRYPSSSTFHYRRIFEAKKRTEELDKFIKEYMPALNKRAKRFSRAAEKAHESDTLKDLTISEEINEYRDWLNTIPGLGDSSIHKYCIHVSQFLEQYDNPDGTPSEDSFNAYVKAHSRFYVRAALRRYAKFRKLDFVPIDDMDEPEKDESLVTPTRETIERIIMKVKNRDALSVLMLMNLTGSRVTAVLKLKFLQFAYEPTGDSMPITLEEKGNKTRVVPIASHIYSEIREYLREEKCLLNGERCFFTNALNDHAAYERLREAIEKEIIRRPKEEDYKPDELTEEDFAIISKTHNIRRGVINWDLVKNGMNIFQTQMFIGHSDPKTTGEYVSALTREKAKAGEDDRMLKDSLNSRVKLLPEKPENKPDLDARDYQDDEDFNVPILNKEPGVSANIEDIEEADNAKEDNTEVAKDTEDEDDDWITETYKTTEDKPEKIEHEVEKDKPNEDPFKKLNDLKKSFVF